MSEICREDIFDVRKSRKSAESFLIAVFVENGEREKKKIENFVFPIGRKSENQEIEKAKKRRRNINYENNRVGKILFINEKNYAFKKFGFQKKQFENQETAEKQPRLADNFRIFLAGKFEFFKHTEVENGIFEEDFAGRFKNFLQKALPKIV